MRGFVTAGRSMVIIMVVLVPVGVMFPMIVVPVLVLMADNHHIIMITMMVMVISASVADGKSDHRSNQPYQASHIAPRAL
jgi:hypothetical protein